MITDSNGLLATINDQGEIDTGDTLSNEFFIRIAQQLKYRKNFGVCFEKDLLDDATVVMTLYRGDGYWKRSPEDALNDGKFTPSRDQWIMAITWCALAGQIPRLTETMQWIAKNLMRYPNGDLASGELYVVLKRFLRFGFYTRFIPLNIWDLWLVFGSMNRCGWIPKYKHDHDYGNGVRAGKWYWFNQDPDDVGDDKVHIALLMTANQIKPTLMSKLAEWIYFKFRPPVYVTDELRQYSEIYTMNNPAAALFWYYRKPSNNPEIAVEWYPLLSNVAKHYQ